MPYIKPEHRKNLDIKLFPVVSSGELNYIITQLLLDTKPQCYEDYNALVGVLECCKLEFYRRAVAKYEDEKIKENGDVF